jgi:hypothetical protein
MNEWFVAITIPSPPGVTPNGATLSNSTCFPDKESAVAFATTKIEAGFIARVLTPLGNEEVI